MLTTGLVSSYGAFFLLHAVSLCFPHVILNHAVKTTPFPTCQKHELLPKKIIKAGFSSSEILYNLK